MDEITPELMEQLKHIVTSNENHLKNIKEIRLILARSSSPLDNNVNYHVEVKFLTNPTQRNFFKIGNSLLECIIQTFRELNQPLKKGADE